MNLQTRLKLGVWILASATLGLSVPVWAQPADINAEVRRLVRQLDARDRGEREAAEKSLLELGPDALPHLPQITDRTPAEVKVRLERISNQLETALAETAALPTKVNLSGSMTLDDALMKIMEQTGNQVLRGRNNNPEIEVSEEDTEFWPALDRLLDKADLAIEPYGGTDNALSLTTRTEGQAGRYGYASYQGPFRFEATRIQAVRDLRNPGIQGLQIHLEMTWEPRMSPISVGIPLSELKAVDDQGNELQVENAENTLTFAVQTGISTVEADLPFALPGRGAKRVAKVTGRCNVLMPGRVETFKFPPLGGAQELQMRKAGVVVVLEGVRKNQALHEVRMRVEFDDAGNALESHRGWIVNNPAYLLDSEGNRVESLTRQTTRQQQNGVGFAYLFDLQKAPGEYRFVYETPALILRRNLTFELNDIDLP